ncbi:MAG: ComEC/Rec2 family competence protein [Bacteroidetes bacterium]|nr:ComEC/Rec2 family competence protein [Bacteroidota bacterium]
MSAEHLRSEAPLLTLLIPQIIGILLYFILPLSLCWHFGIPIILLALLLYGFQYLPDYYRVQYFACKGILLYVLLISVFYLIGIMHAAPSSSMWYKHQKHEYKFAIVQITEPLHVKPKSYKAQVEIKYLLNGHKKIQVQGKAIIYLQHDSSSASLQEGDILCINNLLKDIQLSCNPGAFEYADYCKQNQIYQSAYLPTGSWKKMASERKRISVFFNSIGLYARNILRNHIPNQSSVGIAEALLMGYRNDIDKDIWQAYADTGIVHIIAISGMHMAMIYMSLIWLFSKMPILKNRKVLATFVSLLLMWLFACITGLPPSVNRAALMFTFIAMGDMMNRNISSLNNLAASAFLLLCINPNWLFDIGFQLSYLAVLSLILFYAKVYNVLYVSNKILDAIWKLTSATLAAQILTLPLCIYYFHQFPLLFVLTNLVAVPLTTLVLYAEILLVNLHTIKPLADCLGKIISYSIEWLNKFVQSVSHLPFAVWEGLQFNLIQTILCYGIILSLAIFILQKNKMAFITSFVLITVFIGSCCFIKWKHLQQKQIVIYQIAKQKAIEFISGTYAFSPDENSLQQVKNEKFVLQPAHRFFQIKSQKMDHLYQIKNPDIEAFQFYNLRIVRMATTKFTNPTPLFVDYLILSEKCNPDISWLAKNFKAKHIVLDSSIPFWHVDELQNKLEVLCIPIHIIQNHGALIIDADQED